MIWQLKTAKIESGIERTENVKEYNEDFRFEDGVLTVRLSGKFPEELLHAGMNLFQPLLEACTTYHCKMAIVDARDLEIDFNTMAMFQAGEDAASMARGGLRIANRGGQIGIFTDIDAARAWLQE